MLVNRIPAWNEVIGVPVASNHLSKPSGPVSSGPGLTQLTQRRVIPNGLSPRITHILVVDTEAKNHFLDIGRRTRTVRAGHDLDLGVILSHKSGGGLIDVYRVPVG